MTINVTTFVLHSVILTAVAQLPRPIQHLFCHPRFWITSQYQGKNFLPIMGHPYSGAASYIYANEVSSSLTYSRPFADSQPSFSTFHPRSLRMEPQPGQSPVVTRAEPHACKS
jgi:hypothetical protein